MQLSNSREWIVTIAGKIPDVMVFVVLTGYLRWRILNSVIVLWKLTKPAGGGRVWGSLPLFVLWNARACLKNHFRNLQAPLCGIFYPHSVAVARYAALIRIKSPTNWDSQLTKSFFQTRSRQIPKNSFLSANSFSGSVTERE